MYNNSKRYNLHLTCRDKEMSHSKEPQQVFPVVTIDIGLGGNGVSFVQLETMNALA
jgi:hypothetical protein